MCGIYGEISLKSRALESYHGEKATDLLAHRGPDQRGFWHDEGIFLGMRRLSIIDLSDGNQPIWNEDHSSCVIYNGELYNFLDLRPQLESKGHYFKTSSDTEVILHAYEEWGPECLQHFNGMFAFAIWDRRQHSLFLARDRIGEKPLYYYTDENRLIFASEIKAIVSNPSVPKKLRLRGLANFLAFGHSIAPDTIYQKIFKLLPGHYLIIKNGTIKDSSYWDVSKEPQLLDSSDVTVGEYIDLILTLIDDSVKRRMIADVPVGAFLSGGVDSSAIVALMMKHSPKPVQTFSLGFNIGGAYNELSDARCVAKYLGTEHHELNIEHENLIEILRKLVYHYDEPFGDAAGFPVYLLSRFAREHVKVVLAGDGGDELFGGYRRYTADLMSPIYQLLPKSIIEKYIPNLINKVPRFRRTKRIVKTLPIRDPAKRYASWLILFTPEMMSELCKAEIYNAMRDYDASWPYPHYYNKLKTPATLDHLNRMMYLDLKILLPDVYLEKVDKATMACSLEARLPLLDHRIVELAFQIPGHLKIRGLSTKIILKQSVKHLVPASVINKPKHGFSVPLDPWFRTELKDFTFGILLDDKTRQRGYFNMQVIERLWREHVEGKHIWDTHLWLLLNFELWHRIFLDGDGI